MANWLLAALVIWMAWRLLGKPRKAPLTPAAQARRVLGVGMTAGEGEIRAAHRRLMSELHPDRGGSPERARQVNAARDLLLARLSRDG